MKEQAIVINVIFANEDNTPMEDGKGWADHFHRFLQLMLEQLLSMPFVLNMIDEEKQFKPDENEFLICLLSPNFILSGVALDRLEEQFNHLKEEAHRKHIYKVVKMPVDAEFESVRLKTLNAYNLFYHNVDTNQASEVDNFFTDDAERFFWMKMMDMCYDLHEAIIQKTAVVGTSTPEKDLNIPQRKAIYLAETGQDLVIQRNIIKRELQRNGFLVLPDKTMPENAIEVKEYVAACLKKSQLSIHLIGTSYGFIPVGETKSIVDIQNQMAADLSEEPNANLLRLVWVTPHLKNASERQLTFIHAIKRDGDVSAGAEILQTSLEDFKNILREELLDTGMNKKLRKTKLAENSMDDVPKLYYIFDKKDEREALKLVDQIKSAGYELMQPVVDKKLLETRNHHIDCLKNMDAAIVFQNTVNEQWVHMKLLDLLKAPGFGRNKPIIGKALVISASNAPKSELLTNYGVEIIDVKETKILEGFLKNVMLQYNKKNQVKAG